ncbi:hypothetical protein F5B20DRAFT_287997 [Whalleya microplaca]|nr:hypothetical protein F5B20DRAFT_287997 [Whalleya microplaca]
MDGRAWDVHDFNDPDEDPVTRFRHLGGDYGPSDPSYWDLDDEYDIEWDSDDSFSHLPSEVYEEFEKAQSKYPRNSKDEVDQTPAGPLITLYDTRYFVPQWDEHMLGPAWWEKRGKWDFDNPPKPLLPNDPKMKDAFKYCSECQLTWLVGHDKLQGHKHPEHFAYVPSEHIDLHRLAVGDGSSLVVHVRGDCIAKGQTPKSLVGNPGGTGIYFGKASKYNRAGPQIYSDPELDREKADLGAAELALTIVRFTVLEDLKEISREAKELKDSNVAEEGTAQSDISRDKASVSDKVGFDTSKSDSNTNESDNDEDDDELWEDESEEDGNDDDDNISLRVIMVMDNAKVVDNICKHQDKWKLEKGKLRTNQGKLVKHGNWYQRLADLVDELDINNISVKWYCVPIEFNKEAAELAGKALEGKFEGFEGEPTSKVKASRKK